MDASEKAKEIYDLHLDFFECENKHNKAKKSALITVICILKATPFKLSFWMDVKEELIKL